MNTQLIVLNKKGIEAAVRGRMTEAEKFFRDALKIDPEYFETSFNLIKLLHMNDRYLDAIIVFNHFDNSNLSKYLPLQIISILSDCAVKVRDLFVACECCERLHYMFTDHIELACRFSNILIRTGQLGKSKLVINQTIALNRSDPNLLTQLAIIESELGNYSSAEEIHLQLVGEYSNHFLSNFNFGLFLSMLGRNVDALGYFNRSLEIVPDAPEALSAIKNLSQNTNSLLSSIYDSIESKMYDDVISKLTNSKDLLDPIFYWAALCDIPSNVASAIDDVSFVSPSLQIECLELFKNLEEKVLFLQELEAYINAQESLIWDRAGKPTRFGKQSYEILKGSHNQYIREICNRLKGVINKFMITRPLLAEIAQQKSLKNELSGWGVSLTKGGYQKRHIHPEAVVSGVLYIKLSDESRSCSQNEGNLMFSSSHRSCMITPKEGMVVLFPSYLAHETIPLRNDQERICIAFNLV